MFSVFGFYLFSNHFVWGYRPHTLLLHPYFSQSMVLVTLPMNGRMLTIFRSKGITSTAAANITGGNVLMVDRLSVVWLHWQRWHLLKSWSWRCRLRGRMLKPMGKSLTTKMQNCILFSFYQTSAPLLSTRRSYVNLCMAREYLTIVK